MCNTNVDGRQKAEQVLGLEFFLAGMCGCGGGEVHSAQTLNPKLPQTLIWTRYVSVCVCVCLCMYELCMYLCVCASTSLYEKDDTALVITSGGSAYPDR